MLSKGEKVLVITRRMFPGDLRRHFVGEVEEASDTVVRVRGYVFVFDGNANDFVRREDLRTRIFSLVDAGLVINLLTRDANIEEIRYRWDEKHRRIVTDETSFAMNVTEFGAYR